MTLQANLRQFLSDYPSYFKAGSRILVACSGGPDSVALACALKTISKEKRIQCVVGHVNHHLRGAQSNQDEKFVLALASNLSCIGRSISVKIDRRSGGNLEQKARVARYKALGRLARQFHCSIVLTGHTRDDQAETVLLHLLRGSGVAALAAMSPLRLDTNSKLLIGRPFLDVSKQEILDWLKAQGRSFRIDKSNLDRRLARNWLRTTLIPQIEQKFPGVVRRLAVHSQLVREENNVWDRWVQLVLRRSSRSFRGGTLLDLKKLKRYSPPIQRRTLRRIVGDGLLSFGLLENWRRWMFGPPTQGRFWQLRKGWICERLSKSKGAPSVLLFWIYRKAKIKNHEEI